MKKELNFDQLGHAIVKVVFDKNDLTKISNNIVTELCKQVTISGFRKGHAPIEIARTRISDRAFGDELQRKLSSKSIKALNSDSEIISQIAKCFISTSRPVLTLEKLDNDEAIINISLLLLPEVKTLPNLEDVKVEFKPQEFKDELVDERLKYIQDLEGSLVPSDEPIALENTVTLKVSIYLDDENVSQFNTDNLDVVIGRHTSMLKDHEEDLIGKKTGDKGQIVMQPSSDLPDILKDKKITIKYEIVSVSKKELPEINDEFAKSQTQYKDCDTLDDLKKKIAEDLKHRIELSNKQNRIDAIYNTLLEKTEFIYDNERLKELLVSDQEQRDRQQLAQNGISLEDYLQINKLTREEYDERAYNYLLKPLLVDMLNRKYSEDETICPKIDIEELLKNAGYKDGSSSLKEQLKEFYPYNSDEENEKIYMSRVSNLVSNNLREKISEYLSSKIK